MAALDPAADSAPDPAPGSPPLAPSSQGDELGYRHVSDAKTMRALTHPTRLALIETLLVDGPMTATEAAEKVGESPSSCSFHLRQLARYGFVEEAGGGTGRRRPWKLTRVGMRLPNSYDDPAAEVAHDALSELMRGRQIARYEQWLRSRSRFPRAWQDAAVDNYHVMWLTSEELADLSRRITEELAALHRSRLLDPAARPDGARPVEMLVLGFPQGKP